MVYFDHNATSPLMREARDAWLEAAETYLGNPSSPHRLGARADEALKRAREELAGMLGCDPCDVTWTSGTTESNNTVIAHLARTVPADSEVWISAIEHPCVVAPARRHFGARLRLVPVNSSGVVEMGWLRESMERARPGLVACMAANNETGVLQPWREIQALCQAHGVPFVCDATQWIGRLPCSGLGNCDYLTGSAHKYGGPKGVGFMKHPSGQPFHALLVGGPQEEGRRAGTENVAGVLATVAALRVRERQVGRAREKEGLRRAFEARLLRALPGTRIVGASAPRLWNTVMALMPKADCHRRWVVRLDKLGFAVSTGSACASGKEAPSHVLLAMGIEPGDADGALRFSSSWETSEEDWKALSSAVENLADDVKIP